MGSQAAQPGPYRQLATQHGLEPGPSPRRQASAGWLVSRSLGEELTFGKMTSQAPHQPELVPGSGAWWPEASRDLAATPLLGLTSPLLTPPPPAKWVPAPLLPPLGGPPDPEVG